MNLYLRKVEHSQGRDNQRVVLKDEGDEIEIGSIRVTFFTGAEVGWTWGIDTALPMRDIESEGKGLDRADWMKKFRAAQDRLAADRGPLDEFLEAKRTRS